MGRSRPASALAALPSCVLATLLVAAAGAAVAQPPDEELEGEVVDEEGLEDEGAALPEGPPPGSKRPPTQRWQQILSSPRVGDRLTAVAVDQDNPDLIFVGTAEGTVIRTRDGGITWQEFPVSPFNVLARSVGTQGLFLPNRSWMIGSSDDDAEGENDVLTTPPMLDRRGGAHDEGDPVPPWIEQDLSVGMPPILMAATRSREAETVDIVWITFCPGARYPLLVATARELYGSDDEGQTYTRLFAGSNAVPYLAGGSIPQLYQVACSPVDPEDIVIGTSRGAMRSVDGGLTFTEYVKGAMSGIANSVAWDEAGAQQSDSVALLVAIDSMLFVGDPDSPGGLSYIYPDWNNPGLAPYFRLNSIVTTPSAQIWMGTGEGIRASLDGGMTWQRSGGPLFAGQNIRQIRAGEGFDGGERIALISNAGVYSTDDSGATWHPFFIGMTRRTIQRVASAGSDDTGEGVWFVLTSGELWRSATEEPPPNFDTRGMRRWAQAKLDRTPGLYDVLAAVLERQALTADDIDEVFIRASNRSLIPVVGAQFRWATADEASAAFWRGSRVPLDTSRAEAVPGWSLVVSLTWRLPDYFWPNSVEWPVAELRDLQQQVAFSVEDAWHERRMHLMRLARDGVVDELQAHVLIARVETLEAILTHWLEAPLESLSTGQRARGGT